MYRLFFGILLSNTNAFMISPLNYRKPFLSNIQMSYKPQELLQTLGKGELGSEWTYEDFISNLKGHEIDAATVTDNGRIFFIDNNYDGTPELFNVHLLKSLPSLTDNVISKMTENHINFDVLNMADLPQPFQVPFFVQLFGFYIILRKCNVI